MSTPQTDLIACAETALMLAGRSSLPWKAEDGVLWAGKTPLFDIGDYSNGSAMDEQAAIYAAQAANDCPILAQAVLDLTEKLRAIEGELENATAQFERAGSEACTCYSDPDGVCLYCSCIVAHDLALEKARLLSRITPSQPKEGE